MKKNNLNLNFSKDALVELNNDQIKSTESGGTPASSNFCWAVGAYIVTEIIQGIDDWTQH